MDMIRYIIVACVIACAPCLVRAEIDYSSELGDIQRGVYDIDNYTDTIRSTVDIISTVQLNSIFDLLNDNIPNCYQSLQDMKDLINTIISTYLVQLDDISRYSYNINNEVDNINSLMNYVNLNLSNISDNTSNIKNIKDYTAFFEKWDKLHDNNYWDVKLMGTQHDALISAINDIVSAVNTVGEKVDKYNSGSSEENPDGGGDNPDGGDAGDGEGCKFTDKNINSWLSKINDNLVSYLVDILAENKEANTYLGRIDDNTANIYTLLSDIKDNNDTLYNKIIEKIYTTDTYNHYVWGGADAESPVYGQVVGSSGLDFFGAAIKLLNQTPKEIAQNGHTLVKILEELQNDVDEKNKPNTDSEISEIQGQYGNENGWKNESTGITDDLEQGKEKLLLNKKGDIKKMIGELPTEATSIGNSTYIILGGTWMGSINSSAIIIDFPSEFVSFIQSCRACCRFMWFCLAALFWVVVVRLFFKFFNTAVFETLFGVSRGSSHRYNDFGYTM